ncbi:helix-turn-helix transcriptional regulator [Actinophytocola sp.]|uniref:helix-turn-helix transcriptional regulator n=1 Tax=Actinophytocola sp. TaxID=1872138 RepID=UPI002D4BB209|nr:helix-turn-helix transcriptional regulator [Actinophytocola sp.]HYQ69666.1 helix-turn-helix transcriptional regulator [Actinophytocola sp.]
MPPVPGYRWKALRENRDADQATVAKALDLAKRTYQNIETNPRHIASRRVILRAARYFRCSEEYLNGESDVPGKPPEEQLAPPEPDRSDPPQAELVETS